MRPVGLATLESVAAAKAQAQAERDEFRRVTGVEIGEGGDIRRTRKLKRSRRARIQTATYSR